MILIWLRWGCMIRCSAANLHVKQLRAGLVLVMRACDVVLEIQQIATRVTYTSKTLLPNVYYSKVQAKEGSEKYS